TKKLIFFLIPLLLFLFNFNPFFGAFGLLALAVLAIWRIGEATRLPTETIAGIFFALSLAVGILLTPELELLEALFGDIAKTQIFDALFAVLGSMIVFLVIQKIYKKFMLAVISEDIAKSAGVSVEKINLLFLILVALIVALGVKVVGTLLMGALVIIPAASAKNFCGRMKSYVSLSIIFGILSVGVGLFFSKILNLPPGPIVVLASIAPFLVSLMAVRR
ncbi:MAG: metal ABC transporter permease, partial [Patescibacteria group bacterium]